MKKDLADVSEKEIFFRVFRDSVANTFFFGLGAVIIWFVGKSFWWIGVVLLVIYALIIVADALIILLTNLIPSLITIPVAVCSSFNGDRAAVGKESILLAAQIIRLLEAAIGITFGVLLYRSFF